MGLMGPSGEREGRPGWAARPLPTYIKEGGGGRAALGGTPKEFHQEGESGKEGEGEGVGKGGAAPLS